MMTHSLTPVRVQQRLRREEDGTLREQKLAGEQTHTSVLVDEVLDFLSLAKGDVVVDATLGMGGHSEALLTAVPVTLLALDADPEAAQAAAVRLKRFSKRVRIVNANFRDLAAVLKREKVETISKALFDLGWNMTQLSSGRGFSFMHDEPLHMGYSSAPASGFTAAEILNTWSEKVLADVFFGYGEERYARAIARAVVARRTVQPIATTLELAEIVRDAVPARYRHGRIHPATKTFQALRIAVNDELGAIEQGLKAAWDHLAPGGRIAVITFHSIEDRLVKRLMREYAQGGAGRVLTKKPIGATREEIIRNPSARSAKLRAIEKASK
jgi:16S rRNA (cytosine1402-N4)-methyltransferase